MAENQNVMRTPYLEKVVLNIGVGEAGAKLTSAASLLGKISGKKVVKTKAKIRDPKWGIRPGLEIGAKVTLRGKDAEEMLRGTLKAVKNQIKRRSFSDNGNVCFGIAEYIDLPNVKYDPNIGIYGMDVAVKLSRAGDRISRRKLFKKKLPPKQKLTREESIEFMEKNYDIKVID